MEDFLEQTIEQYTARIGEALDFVSQDLSNEQTALATKCRTVLNDSQQKLEKLTEELSVRKRENRNQLLREFQRIIRDVEYVETVGITALERSNESDEKLNFLLKKIRQEINYPLPLPPSVTATSREYFYIHTRFDFNLICVPPGERNSFLHLPDLYHELAHPLLTEKNLSKIKPFQDGLKNVKGIILRHFTTEILQRSRRRGPDTTQLAETWLQNWYQYWATEFFCDLFAVFTLGPAFVWSHYNLCAKKTDNPFEISKNSSSHPADDARMSLMLFALDRIGFVETANEIQSKWDEFTESTEIQKEIEFDQCYPRKLISEIEEIAFQSIEKTGVRIASPDTNDFVHNLLNNAWKKFWEDGNSYSDWQTEEIKRLYDYCDNAPKIKLTVKERKIMVENREDSLIETQNTFRTALAELKHGIGDADDLTGEFPFLHSDDIKKLRLEFNEPPRGGIYDHNTFERKFFLSGKLLSFFDAYWNTHKTNESQRKRMCKLFFFHEFFHTPQHVDSNTYPLSKNSKNSFRYADYNADAFAVKSCLKTESSYLPWNEQLAEILISHVRGGEVFAQADDGRISESIEGERFHRQTIWLLQYARARAFRAEGGFGEFYLDRQIILEIFHILPNGAKENLCLKDSISPHDFQNVLEIHISWGGIRFIYSLTNKHFINNFVKGVFQCDFDAGFEAFRPLFDSQPELIGRGNNFHSVNFADKTVEEFDRPTFFQNLRSLHGEDLGQIIISIPNASQKVSFNETNARKIEQLITWAESRSGPGIEKIYQVAKKLFPTHF